MVILMRSVVSKDIYDSFARSVEVCRSNLIVPSVRFGYIYSAYSPRFSGSKARETLTMNFVSKKIHCSLPH